MAEEVNYVTRVDEIKTTIAEATTVADLLGVNELIADGLSNSEGIIKIQYRSVLPGKLQTKMEELQAVAVPVAAPAVVAVAAPAPPPRGITVNNYHTNITSTGVLFYRLPQNGGYPIPHRDPRWMHEADQRIEICGYNSPGLFEALRHVKESDDYNNHYLICPTYTEGGIFKDCQLSLTGKLKGGEAVLAGITRELEEEIGLTLQNNLETDLIFRQNYVRGPRRTSTCILTDTTTRQLPYGVIGAGGIVPKTVYEPNNTPDSMNDRVQIILIMSQTDANNCAYFRNILTRRLVTTTHDGAYHAEKIPAVTCIPLNRINLVVDPAGHGVITFPEPAAPVAPVVLEGGSNNGLISRTTSAPTSAHKQINNGLIARH